ncbi:MULTISPECIES: sulfatase [unclassified Lentimonas]|uniref:sulfatase n=1 Tax=unclassified Lentimonas TaxID=2630993 RepID=UPI00132BA290|nr:MULTISPECIES: sulfatase [unclassified Lentimonas]CAA6696519.1 Unannotated [Lentimonas sp. CC19]CAA6696672.1 Unannotated [Lentimonas sp. CC10]CAA7072446.1 Unannotated [Lentimonas sp. CC11]
MKTTTSLLASLLLTLTFSATAHAAKSNAPTTAQPNIVLLFVDDMGWDDMGYRDPLLDTPNLDALAADSLDFQQAYIATPTCSPSRATLLTGQHPARIKMVRHIPNDIEHGFDKYGRTDESNPVNYWKKDPAQFPCPNWLALEYTSYAEALKDLGYYNLFVGKWHLGHEPFHPIHQGFDRQIGTGNAGHPKSYYPPYFHHSDVMADETERYLTDKLTDETVNFIEHYEKEQPFMISLWYYTVHGPHVGRKDLLKHYLDKGFTGKEAHYAAMVSAMDESVGRVRAALAAKGIDKETIIIFLSDQGGMFENKPFHGGKKADTLYEGGARVPFMVNWPGVTVAAQNNSLVQSTDLFPTLVEIAGGDPSQYENLDGVTLLPTIRNNSILDRGEPLFGYRAYEDLYASVREGDWKLLAYRSGTLKLYNIANDIGEQKDLAATHPEKVDQLVKKLKAWEKEMEVDQYSGVQ